MVLSSLDRRGGGVSPADPAINGAIRGLNAGELYTVARVSCFRDNAIPRADMSLGIKSSAGNWRDEGDCPLAQRRQCGRPAVCDRRVRRTGRTGL